MRLQNFVLEATGDEEKDLEMIRSFRADTTQYYVEMGGVRLWRGSKKRPKNIQKYEARGDRHPLDTPTAVHTHFDNAFKKKFGWKARSQSVFAASAPTIADNFGGGHSYLFYPANGYRYLWSGEIDDLTQHLEDGNMIIQKNERQYELFDNWYDEKERDKMTKSILNTYTDKNLPKTSWGGREVMFHCPNGYYMIGGQFFSEYYREIYEDYN